MATLQLAFSLPPGDVEYLDSLGLEWETVSEGSAHWLLVHDFVVPQGYTTARVIVALRIEPGYPDTQLDMAYFLPALDRSDGQAVRRQSVQQISGESFQRWSRHRTAQNPWRPGVDEVSTHMGLVTHWLDSELLK